MEIKRVNFDEDHVHINVLNLEFIDWAWKSMKEVYNIELVQFNDKYKTKLESRSRDATKMYGSVVPPHGVFYLIWDDQVPVGMGGVYRNESNFAEIKRMYIKHSHRSKGYGRKLLELLLNEAKLMNIKTVRLDSMKLMTEAHKLYRSMGFKEIDAYSDRIPDELKLYYLFMELHL